MAYMSKEFNPNHPFELPPVPSKIDLSQETLLELVEARVALSGLSSSLEAFENKYQLIQIPALQESVSSSNIENIRTTVQGALEDSAKDEKDQQSGNKEALKYRNAIFEGWKSMDKWGLGSRTILKIHEVLDVKEAGGYRHQQNSIIDELGEPIYTPPSVASLSNHLSGWENFVNENSSEFHPVIKSCLAHYQFEAIHPFADGNGRTGRILMVLQLVQDKILPVPAFYISGYLKENSVRYKDLLLEISKNQTWDEYLRFMLKGFRLQAIRTKEIISKIRDLKLIMKREIRKELPKIYSADLINHLFESPVTFPTGMEKELGISRNTAGKYLGLLEKKGFLKKRKSGKYVLFANTELLRILFEKPKK